MTLLEAGGKRSRDKSGSTMTPEQHNKYLAYSHLGYGGLMGLCFILFLSFFGVMLGVIGGSPDGPPFALMALMWTFIAVMYAAMIVPSLVAGFALLKGKRWARTASIIGGVVAAMQFPLGTAVCIYTFWFLFSEPGKQIFDQQRLGLPPSQEEWFGSPAAIQKEVQYTPPSTPPDWR